MCCPPPLTFELLERCTPRHSWSRHRLQGAPVCAVASGSAVGGNGGGRGSGVHQVRGGAACGRCLRPADARLRRVTAAAKRAGLVPGPLRARAAPGRGSPISQSNLPSSMTDGEIWGTSARSTPGFGENVRAGARGRAGACARALPAHATSPTSAARAQARFHFAAASPAPLRRRPMAAAGAANCRGHCRPRRAASRVSGDAGTILSRFSR